LEKIIRYIEVEPRDRVESRASYW